MRRIVVASVAALSIVMAGCGVKVQTGQTQDEAIESAERRANIMRRDWAAQLQSASPVGMASMVGTRIDSTAGTLFGFGERVLDEWRKANAGRGAQVPASEMRQIVDAWVRSQQPILEAYEDNINKGMAEVQATNHFDRPTLDLLEQMVRQYDAVYSKVFFPNGSADDYQDNLMQERKQLERLSDDYHRQVANYR